jgi:hypothetical protein
LYISYSTGIQNYEILVDKELRRTWKEVVMICFKIIVQHLPGKTNENKENPES